MVLHLFSAESEVKSPKPLQVFRMGFQGMTPHIQDYKQAFATQVVKFLEYKDGYWRIGLSFYSLVLQFLIPACLWF